jgi:hypothetical protein
MISGRLKFHPLLMGVIGHDHGSMQVEFAAAFLQTAFKNNVPGFSRQFRAVVCGESDKDWPIILTECGEDGDGNRTSGA